MDTTRKHGRHRIRFGPLRPKPTPPTPRRSSPFVVGRLHEGYRLPDPEDTSLAPNIAFAESDPDNLVVVIDPTPTPEKIHELAEVLDLHSVLVEDLLHADQRPKLERYGDVLFVVARAARYIDESEEVKLAEFHVLVKKGIFVLLCQDWAWIDGRPAAEVSWDPGAGHDSPVDRVSRDILAMGPEAVLYRFLDAVVDGFAPVLRGIEIDKEQIERQVFSGDAAVAERIYRLSQEVIDVQHAIVSLIAILLALRRGFGEYEVREELRTYLQDVGDHLERARVEVRELRDSLAQILQVNATLVAQRQNEDMKKISGWAAILFAPTLIAAVYGMNFDHMPELHWALGYPLAVGGMVAFAAVLYVMFKWKKWM